MASKTYTGTWMCPDLTKAEITLYISQVNKYERGSRIYMNGEEPEDETKVVLTGVKSWTLVEGGEEAKAVEQVTNIKDEYDEYLILRFEDGKTEIYPNTRVTMFIW